MCKHLSHFGMQFKNIWFSKVVYIYALNVALQQFSFFPPHILSWLNLYNLLQQHMVELTLMIWCQEKCLRITQHESKISKMYVHAAMPTKRDIKHTSTNTEDYNNALYRATDTLVKWVDDTIRDIEIQSEKKVVKFYIGKTYVHKNKKSKVFDAMNPNTWRKEGIRSRWCHHKHQDYGRNGMVVLTVVIPRSVIFTSQKKTLYVALTLIPGFHQNYQCQTVMTKQTHSPSHKMKIY